MSIADFDHIILFWLDVLLSFKMNGYTSREQNYKLKCLPPFSKGDQSSWFASLVYESNLKGAALKGKQILFFKNSPPLRREVNTVMSEWAPLEVYPLT